ncbi:Pogo transposable element with KRAB domain [Heterocephalus glaber]|uniref:Pogo transposable element with KRAB domain n=1 Tax=Heterocephalus glaber TaxID=10181 RepID=G5B1T7_HETGA|nr:Pogo transposable element with KRAB domain [Heterocephalus glaber]
MLKHHTSKHHYWATHGQKGRRKRWHHDSQAAVPESLPTRSPAHACHLAGEMEPKAYPLNVTLKEEQEEEEIRSRELEDGPTDMQKVRICSEGGWVPALFDEVAIYFSDEEWEVLTEQQKALYWEVMRMNYETVLSLEFPFPKPDMIS